jgi:radical SAM superfamily enzyme YgiQ (UPF0313 family)
MKNVDLLLINPPFHTRNGGGSFFPLGLGYIISSVEACGYSWGVIDCTKMINSFFENELEQFEKKLLVEIQKYTPLLIGVGPCITSQLKALKIISKCCMITFPSVPCIAGGPLATIEGQDWLFFEELSFDYIVKGDGEYAIPDAIKAAINTGNVANSKMLSNPNHSVINEISDINAIPFPHRGLSGKDFFSTRRVSSNYSRTQAAMITSRGCPYSCNYCVSGNLKRGKNVRKRSVNNIILEMEYLHKNHKINDIIFYDDCFFSNPKTISADVKLFCEALLCKDLHMTWQIELRPDILIGIGDEFIRLLESSGCRQINLGIEKVSSSGLRFLGKSNTIDALKKRNFRIRDISNIDLSGTFILGGGNETRNDIIQLINESKSLGLNFVHYNPLFVYPGTPLYNILFDNDRVWTDIIYNDILPWGEIVYENKDLNCSDLLDLVDFAYSEFYKNTEYAEQQMVADRFNIKCGGNRCENI